MEAFLTFFILFLSAFGLFIVLKLYLSLKEEKLKKIVQWVLYGFIFFVLAKVLSYVSLSENMLFFADVLFMVGVVCILLMCKQLMMKKETLKKKKRA